MISVALERVVDLFSQIISHSFNFSVSFHVQELISEILFDLDQLRFPSFTLLPDYIISIASKRNESVIGSFIRWWRVKDVILNTSLRIDSYIGSVTNATFFITVQNNNETRFDFESLQ